MDTNIVVSIISASSAVIVAIAALVLNVVWMGKAFGQLDKGIDVLRQDTGQRFGLIEGRLNKIESKLDSIDTRLNEMTLDIAKLKAGLHE